MPAPDIACFLNMPVESVDREHPMWDQPLPDHRGRRRSADAVHDDPVSYGAYFQAILQFCSADDWSAITAAAAHRLKRAVKRSSIGRVSIYLEKHGAFYHPARLQVEIEGRPLSFVVNVAVSDAGRATLPREVDLLCRLNDRCPFGWLPEVYASTTLRPAADRRLAMFLGNWFDGYHELHLTRQAPNDESAVIVWDGAAAPTYLDATQKAAFYRQAAMILTACYDPVNTCQIVPWHHAAGDFVIRLDTEHPTVRLITVRDYVPLNGQDAAVRDERELLETLAAFLVHLTIRTRLDRLDGTGRVVWAPDAAVPPTLDGFFQGLDLTARLSGFPKTFGDLFSTYMQHCPEDALASLASQVTTALFQPDSEEQRVIGAQLDRHLKLLRDCLAA